MLHVQSHVPASYQTAKAGSPRYGYPEANLPAKARPGCWEMGLLAPSSGLLARNSGQEWRKSGQGCVPRQLRRCS